MSRNLNIWSNVLDESGTDGAECSRKVVSRRMVAGAIRSLVNDRNLQLECTCIEHCLCLFLCIAAGQCYGKRAVQMDNLRV